MRSSRSGSGARLSGVPRRPRRELLVALALCAGLVGGVVGLTAIGSAGPAPGHPAQAASQPDRRTGWPPANANKSSARFPRIRTKASTASPYDATVLGDHPVAFWDMAARSGMAEADHTGNGNVGTYQGGAPTLTVMPNGDPAVAFNGAGEFMRVPSSPVFSIPTTHELTWEAWIRPDALSWSTSNDPSDNHYVDWMGKCADDRVTACEWLGRLYDTVNPQGRCNRLSAYAYRPRGGEGSGAFWQAACSSIRPGQWYYVVAEYQTLTTPDRCGSGYPGTINIWVDGVEWNPAEHGTTGCMSQWDVSPNAGSSPLTVGTVTPKGWFVGAVGKVAIYDHLLTPGEIASHFVAMTHKRPSGSCLYTCTVSATLDESSAVDASG
jgi:Concanavalin A-like lectin/glucanases superfamily